MADDLNQGPYDGPFPYKDEALQYADLIGNVLNPPAAGPAGPAPAPKQPSPADVTRTGAPQTGLAPNQHWESVTPTPAATPAATSQDGAAAGPSSWADLVRSNKAKLQQDQGELSRLQTTGPGVNQITNPILRGIAKVGDVAGSIVAPGMAANIPGTTLHNRLLQGQAQGRVTQDETALSDVTQNQDREAQMGERAARAAKENAQASAYAPRTLSAEDAAAIGHPELTGESMDQRAYSSMLTTKQRGQNSLDVANANNTTKSAIADKNNETKTSIADNRNTTVIDAAKIRHATRATAGRSPNDALRQPMIDAATAQINKLNTFEFDETANDGKGGFYDPSNPQKVLSPEEFTAMKNTISTKLDKDLAMKKLHPLGVRFDVNSTTPGRGAAQPAAAPAKAPQAAPAKQPAAANPPAGATHQYRDKSGNIVGYAVNGKYVPVGAK